MFTTAIRAVDENGAPLADVTVTIGDTSLTTNGCGEVAVPDLTEPVMAVLSSSQRLSEPVVLGASDRGSVVEVRLLDNAGGTRWAMHSGGDVMLTRRFEDNPYGDPLIPAGDIAGGARLVVAPVAPAFALADLSTVNVETVVSDLPPSAGYPAKRVLVNSRPETMSALDALGVDVAILGNNHIRDFFDDGVRDTITAITAAGIPSVGAADDETANAPLIVDAAGTRVGILSYTTLDGNTNNDRYPLDGDPVPGNLDPEDAFQYEARTWSFTGATLSVPAAARRIGSAWRIFRDAEPTLDAAETAQAWASLYAVYPELQDWVARRGHGGAAWWRTSTGSADIAALVPQVDLVMVQIHGGLEFRQEESRIIGDHARAAIDAGADIVIAHHPHVLQGMEWYKGHPIVYSLGNFIFDQHYEITTPTAFLRTIWDGTELLEVRMLPLDLGNYRPNPVADAAARRQVRQLWEKSINSAYADRDASGEEYPFLDPVPDNTVPAQVRMRSHDAVFTTTPVAAETSSLTLASGETAAVDDLGLVHARAGGANVLMGRDLFGWGDMEDMHADGATLRDLHWRIIHSDAGLRSDDQAASGTGYATMFRHDRNTSEAWVSTFARIALPPHNYYHDRSGVAEPADGAATYTIEFQARMTVDNMPALELDQFERDESLPSRGLLGEYRLPFTVPADGQWHPVRIDVPAEALLVGNTVVGAIKPQFRLPPPPAGDCELAIDQFRVIEWRPAAAMPDLFGAFDFIRNPGATEATIAVEALPLHDR